MDINTFNQNFAVSICKFEFVNTFDVDIGWTVKCNNNEHQKNFFTAYTVSDNTLSHNEIISLAWVYRKDEIFQWAQTVINVSSVINQIFVPPNC